MSSKLILLIVLLFFKLQQGVSLASAKEPENLHTLKQEVIFYHDSGEYDFDQEAVAQRARDYLDMRINQDRNNQKLAVDFDIDETALSNYQHMLKLNFGMIPQLVAEDVEKAQDPAIEDTFIYSGNLCNPRFENLGYL